MGLSSVVKLKAIYKPKKCLQIIKSYHDYIMKCAQAFDLHPALIMAVLYRELTCYGYDDLLAYGMVVEYYKGGLFARFHKKKDSSTGLAQIFAKTAINAEKKLGFNTTRNTWKMWNILRNDYNSIYYCAMVLRVEAMKIGYKRRELISYNNYKSVQKIFTGYNGSSGYGKIVLKIYKEFLKGLGVKNI